MKYTGVNHLAMVTSDMEGTIRFWRDLLGMRMIAGLGEPGYRHYFFEISKDDMLAFFEWPEAEPVAEKEHGRKVSGPIAFDHVSIGLESEAMLWVLKDRLNASDIWVSEVIDHGFIHSIYSFDPNGIPIEFSWSVPELDLRKNPVMLDSNPSCAALEGPEPESSSWPQNTDKSNRRIYPGQGSEFFRKKRA